MNDEDLEMLHCNDLEDGDATLCGFLFASILRMTSDEEAVTCHGCLEALDK